jgi:hypothetical protein
VPFLFRHPGSPESFVDLFRNYYGPTMNAFDAAEKNGKAGALQKDLEELFAGQNQSPDKGNTLISVNFLRVTVTV